MQELDQVLEAVKDESSFLVFVKALVADREQHEDKAIDEVGFVEDWANNNISSFLESAVSWAEDSNFGINQEPELATNKWKQFAVFLYCGKIYE
jgi:hypothetical protein